MIRQQPGTTAKGAQASNRMAVLETLEGASCPLSSTEIALQIKLTQKTVRVHLNALEQEMKVERVAVAGTGNSVRWKARKR